LNNFALLAGLIAYYLGGKTVCLRGKLFIICAIMTHWLNFRHRILVLQPGIDAARSPCRPNHLETAALMGHMGPKT
jgi:hypothetical protein